uniref:V-SNARE coiled-coil homology domain-containing protein n=1 Tax=Crocodylus porosus TaxID=8502 RepID=A0A7M4FVQ3_CROPO
AVTGPGAASGDTPRVVPFLLQVVDIMRVNVDKVLERDEIVSKLDDRADAVKASASVFESSAGKLKRKYFWKNMKGVVCCFTLLLCSVLFLSVWWKNAHIPRSL